MCFADLIQQLMHRIFVHVFVFVNLPTAIESPEELNFEQLEQFITEDEQEL